MTFLSFVQRLLITFIERRTHTTRQPRVKGQLHLTQLTAQSQHVSGF
jgi:hypothetical protein